MMFPGILRAAAAAIVLLGVKMVQTNACTCIAVYYTPCDYVTGLASGASLVVRATALSRSLQTDINDPITYTVDVTTVFLGDTGGQDEIAFLTPGNSAACGISLEIGEEYVLALFPYTVLEDPFDLTGGSEGGLSVEACGLWRKWSDIPSEEKADLEAGCPAEDLCIPICDEDQECVQYQKNGKFYCSDTCENFTCEGGRHCSTRPKAWCRYSGFEGCPERRRCSRV